MELPEKMEDICNHEEQMVLLQEWFKEEFDKGSIEKMRSIDTILSRMELRRLKYFQNIQ